MTENKTNEPLSLPLSASSSSLEQGSESEEESDQRWQDMQMQRCCRNERTRLVIIGGALLGIILSYLFFRLTGNVLPLFVTIVVVFLGYRRIDRHLDKSERSRP